LALTVLEGIMEGLRHQGRPRRQWIHDIEEWTGCEYVQLKEMSQDRAQWRRKISEWSSAVANPHLGRSTGEWVSVSRVTLVFPRTLYTLRRIITGPPSFKRHNLVNIRFIYMQISYSIHTYVHTHIHTHIHTYIKNICIAHIILQ